MRSCFDVNVIFVEYKRNEEYFEFVKSFRQNFIDPIMDDTIKEVNSYKWGDFESKE